MRERERISNESSRKATKTKLFYEKLYLLDSERFSEKNIDGHVKKD